MQNKFITYAKLNTWLTELAQSFEVWAPQKSAQGSKNVVIYKIFKKDAELELNKKSVESAKKIIFPRSETLINFVSGKDPNNQAKPAIELKLPAEPAPSLIFGILPCDARGFLVFDPVYEGSGTNGKFKDIYYLKRRKATVLITKACSNVLSTCFCNWMGSSPSASEGSDVLASEVANGFLLQPLTARGEKVLTSSLLEDAHKAQLSEAREKHEEALKKLAPAPNIENSMEALLAKFDDANFWEAESSPCLSCGACTFLCPTCYCFSISDERAGLKGVRLRSWDACMLPLFTNEASGHNPRMEKAQRLRNRVGHKFSYYPKRHAKHVACCGCGRCIKSCPSSVDIRRIVTDALGQTQVIGLAEATKE